MQPIPNATPATRLFVHAAAAALAQTAHADGAVITLDFGSDRQPSPMAQRELVTLKLTAAMTALEKVIRAQKAAIAEMPTATTGRVLAQRGERYDAVSRTYTPGPGVLTMVNALAADTQAALESAGII